MTTDSRQQLYDRIRESSMDEVTLEEMIRYGFWAKGNNLPSVPEEMIARRGELQREIADLAKKANAYRNPDRAIAEIMKQRMAEAKARRIETKERQAAERNARAQNWFEKKRDDVVHLGDDVSGALQNRESDAARLAAHGVPAFDDVKDIAAAMGVSLGELRFLAYDRKASKVTHYKRFRIAKKTGGYRTLSAPMPRLKRAQYWLLDTIIEKVEPHDAAHGFRAARSILTNAAPHQKKAVVINFDLKDFFPSIGYRRVKGLFRSFGYAEAQAAVFALLATEADRSEMRIDGETWHVAQGERALPQGAPTSPAITNLLCRKLDRRLTGLARKFGFAYTRYADDLTFSAEVENGEALRKLMWSVNQVVTDEGFALNEEKTRVMRKNARQEVTGITVNDGLTVSRQERRKFRAHLHQTKAGRSTGPFRKGSPKASALGYAQFLTMVHGDEVERLTGEARALYGQQDAPRFGGSDLESSARPSFRRAAAMGQAPTETWWTPKEAEAPKPEVVAQPQLVAEQPKTSVVPTTRTEGRRHAEAGATRERPEREQQHPSASAPSGTGKKVIHTIGAMGLLLIPVIGTFLAGVALYFIWFHKRR